MIKLLAKLILTKIEKRIALKIFDLEDSYNTNQQDSIRKEKDRYGSYLRQLRDILKLF